MSDATTAWLNSLTKETLVSMVQNQAEQIKQMLGVKSDFKLQLDLGHDAITFRVTEKEIIITKSGPTLEELLSQCTAENRHSEVFSDSCGKELL